MSGSRLCQAIVQFHLKLKTSQIQLSQGWARPSTTPLSWSGATTTMSAPNTNAMCRDYLCLGFITCNSCNDTLALSLSRSLALVYSHSRAVVYCSKPSEDGGVKQDTTALEWCSSATQ